VPWLQLPRVYLQSLDKQLRTGDFRESVYHPITIANFEAYGETVFEIFVFEELQKLFVEGFLGAVQTFIFVFLRWYSSIRRRIVLRDAAESDRLMNGLVVRYWLHLYILSSLFEGLITVEGRKVVLAKRAESHQLISALPEDKAASFSQALDAHLLFQSLNFTVWISGHFPSLLLLRKIATHKIHKKLTQDTLHVKMFYMDCTIQSSNIPPSWLSCGQEVMLVSLGQKLKQLRSEKGWSQDEFAFHAQIDGRQVSRYENDKVVPSVEVIVKIAKAFNVCIDFLLIDNAPKKSLEAPHSKLAERILAIDDLSEEDERSLLHLVDAIVAKNKLKALANGIE
jgi:transcriptional regulator with XRE-family HTH domain